MNFIIIENMVYVLERKGESKIEFSLPLFKFLLISVPEYLWTTAVNKLCGAHFSMLWDVNWGMKYFACSKTQILWKQAGFLLVNSLRNETASSRIFSSGMFKILSEVRVDLTRITQSSTFIVLTKIRTRWNTLNISSGFSAAWPVWLCYWA